MSKANWLTLALVLLGDAFLIVLLASGVL